MRKQHFIYLILGLFLILAFVGIFLLDRSFGEVFSSFRKVFRYSLIIYIVGIAIMMFLDNPNPYTTVSWLLVLSLLPYVGLVLYILIGRNPRKRKAATLRKSLAFDGKTLYKGSIYSDYYKDDVGCRDYGKLIYMLENNSGSVFTVNNDIKVLTNGKEKFEYLFRELENATEFIHVEYFIIKNDATGQKFKDILIRKALQGVEVRLIYDSVGCWKLGKKYIRELKEAGVKVHAFYPVVFPILSRELNFRNHRKIVVIDGKTGFLGGLNIGDEYATSESRLGFWRDTHMMIEGEAVKSLQRIFLGDWHFVVGERLTDDRFFPNLKSDGRALAQISASGPDSDWESIHQGYFVIIASARKRLWIETPYLVPDDSVKMALKTAALGGVDVRIIIPARPDHFFVYWASRDNIEPLLEAGVRIYTYEKGFVHTKKLVADGRIATLGSANLDMRSFGINYEVNAFIYDKDTIERLEQDFLGDIADSKEIILREHRRRGLHEKVLEGIGRIISPIQ